MISDNWLDQNIVKIFKKLALSVLFVALSLSSVDAAVGQGQPAPEFGSSVTFAKDHPEIKMADLKGKAVLLIFFQSY